MNYLQVMNRQLCGLIAREHKPASKRRVNCWSGAALSLALSMFSLSAGAQVDPPEGACRIDRIEVKDINVIAASKGMDANGAALAFTLSRVADVALNAYLTFGTGGVATGYSKFQKAQRVFSVTESAVSGDSELPSFTLSALNKEVEDEVSSPQFITEACPDDPECTVESTLNDLISIVLANPPNSPDQLLVSVGGRKVLPLPNARYPVTIFGAEVDYRPDEDDDFGYNSDLLPQDAQSQSFIGSTFVQFWENDVGADNDDLGKLDVAWEGDSATGPLRPEGELDTSDQVRVLVGPKEEGSIYEFTYALTPGTGNLDEIPERLFCSQQGCWSGRPNPSNGAFGNLEGGALGACPPNYVNRGDVTTDRNFGFTYCTLDLACGDTFDDLEIMGGVSALRDGDIIALQSRRVLSPDGVYPYVGRVGLGLPGDVVKDDAIASILDPSRTDAQWRVSKLPDGKFTLRALRTNKLLNIGGFAPGGVEVNVNGADSGDNTDWTIEQANEGFYLSQGAFKLYVCDGCASDEDRLGYNYSLRATPGASDDSSRWTILVKDRDRRISVDTTIEALELDSLTRLVIDPGITYTINGDIVLDDLVDIENYGTIIINGAVRSEGLINNLGGGSIVVNGSLIVATTLINSGVLSNFGTVRGLGDRVRILNTSTGIISDNRGAQAFATVKNDGAIFATPGSWYEAGGGFKSESGTNMVDFTTTYFGLPYDTACQRIGGGVWDEATSTCTAGGYWVQEGEGLYVSEGVTLKTGDAAIVNRGTITNLGVIDNANGGFFSCENATIQGNPSTNIPSACISSEEQQICEGYGGTWYPGPGTPTCTGSVFVRNELRITAEMNWNLDSILMGCYVTANLEENDFMLTVDACPEGVGNPLLIVDADATLTVNAINFYRGPGQLINYGDIRFGGGPDIPDGASQPALGLLGTGRVDNYGVISPAIAVGFEEVGNTGSYYNYCDATGEIVGDQGAYFGIRDSWGFPTQVTDLCPGVDSDGDGVDDLLDPFPNDPLESVDSDYDGVGDGADLFPNDASEQADADGDGVGDASDDFPDDALRSKDSDRDGISDNDDAFPLDPTEWADDDADGEGNFADSYNNAVTEGAADEIVVTTAPGAADSSCSLTDVSTAPVTALPPAGMTVTTSEIGFSLRGCATDQAESLRIIIDLGENQRAGATAYKYSGASGWTRISGAAINGSVLSYVVVDNGPLDSNEILGEIDDPVVVLSSVSSVPSMPYWLLVVMALGLCYLGGRMVRSLD
ncbi:choice-of-anchor U domain-containing protein [Congregibacter variabilis]|uniref:Choice-of-anchor U domain-containing protein n=1 Tax=Congregibacter variabilis TaxID=3081200 RepID=A0ABZ0I801_9GAMM|nr:choice-of-anchor U domain-containing protein [Congregibacter sp. IMCC43200]